MIVNYPCHINLVSVPSASISRCLSCHVACDCETSLKIVIFTWLVFPVYLYRVALVVMQHVIVKFPCHFHLVSVPSVSISWCIGCHVACDCEISLKHY